MIIKGGENMAKKKTKEEYVEQLKIKNPDIELVGDYIDDHTKTLHCCNKHNVLCDLSPNKALQGRGCKECGKEKYKSKRGKSEVQYIEELLIKNPAIKLRGNYINNNTPVEHYCETHDILFNIRPYDALHGKGCKMCKSDKLRAKLLKPEEEYIKELANKNPNAKLVGKYLGMDVATEHKCLIHNVVWMALPHNVLYGKGCCYCLSEKISNKLRKSEEQYISELLIKNPYIKLTGEYIHEKMSTEHYCEKHNIFFNISPECALRGYGCRQCASEKLRMQLLKPEEQYILELKMKHPHIVLRDKYLGTHINTSHECLLCGHKWDPKPANLLSGMGCPCCNESKGEKAVAMWLKSHGIDYISQKKFNNCRDRRELPFDFYLPNYNVCIEYQGKQHYEAIDYFGGKETLLYTQYHDQIKFDYCMDNHICLICIPYWEDMNEYLSKNLLI